MTQYLYQVPYRLICWCFLMKKLYEKLDYGIDNYNVHPCHGLRQYAPHQIEEPASDSGQRAVQRHAQCRL